MNKKVEDVMTKQFPILRINDPLTKAHKLMEEWKIKAIPVLNKMKVVGVVSLEDISRVYTLMSDSR